MHTLSVYLMRHAQRVNNEDRITEIGRREAEQLGKTYLSGCEQIIAGLCSTKNRTLETLEAFLKGVKGGIMPMITESFLNNSVSSVFDEQWLNLEKQDRNAGVDMYLQYREKRPDAETISPYEIAARVSYLIRKYTLLGSDGCLVLVSHSGIFEAFLSFVLYIEHSSPRFRSVQEIGGILNYSEIVQLDLSIEDTHIVSGAANLRNKVYQISPDSLASLAANAR